MKGEPVAARVEEPYPSLLIKGGTVVDGTGSDPFHGDVLVRDGRVAAVHREGVDRGVVADHVIEAHGRVVCPGFVDIHTHSDLTLLSNPGADSKVLQGVTTEVVGNCGLGLAPMAPDADVDAVREAVAYLDLDEDVPVGWRTVGEYLARVEQRPPVVNLMSFAAHLPIRASVVGFDDVAPDGRQLQQMCELLDEALTEGAVGLSTGLAYAPLCFAPVDELMALGEVVARHDRLFAWHVRDYGDDLLASVDVALSVADRTGCRVQISHLVSVGRRNWGTVERVLERIDALRNRGVDVGVDVYPYLAGNAPLSQVLPAWAQEGGVEQMRARLDEEQVRARVRAEWSGQPGRPLGWDEIVPVWLPHDGPEWARGLLGSSVAEGAARLERSADDVALDLVRDYGSAALIVAHGRSAEDLTAVLRHPAAVVASDGQALANTGPTGRGVPHPRSYGTFARYLSEYAADLADGVRRCTSAPAARVGLYDRGALVPGATADVVVFDRGDLADVATFERPRQHPAGIEHVLVGGAFAVRNGVLLGTSRGSVLRAG